MIGLADSVEVLVLASGSPRRAELLSNANIPFEQAPADVEELVGGMLPPFDLCSRNACLKAETVALRYPERFVLGADTIVVLGDEVLGKPRDLEEAKSYLRKLSGRPHKVLTGVALRQGQHMKTFVVSSFVKFLELSEETIEDYVGGVEVLDKAGGYAVQDQGVRIIERVEGGGIENVMGLPIHEVARHLSEMGFPVPELR